MKVQFRTNLGSVDADVYGLDFKHCTNGATIEVADEIGVRLVNRGLAVHLPEPETPPIVETQITEPPVEIPPVVESVESGAVDEPEEEQTEAQFTPRRRKR